MTKGIGIIHLPLLSGRGKGGGNMLDIGDLVKSREGGGKIDTKGKEGRRAASAEEQSLASAAKRKKTNSSTTAPPPITRAPIEKKGPFVTVQGRGPADRLSTREKWKIPST